MNKKIKMLFFLLLSVVVVVVTYFFGASAKVIVGHTYIDIVLGFALLFSLSGMSVYNSIIPSIVIGVVWGVLGGDILVISIPTLMISSYFYKRMLKIRPLSPLNVYKATLVGTTVYFLLSYCFKGMAFSTLIIEAILALAIVKSTVNTFREVGLINHEDPRLIAQIEKDYLNMTYQQINRLFNTNLQRPQKPKK